MSKYRLALLTCDDLTGYVTDDNYLLQELKRDDGFVTEMVPWTNVKWDQHDLAIIRTTWDYTERLSEFLETLEIAEKKGCRLFNSYSTVCWNANKKYLKDLEQKDVPVIPTAVFCAENDFSFDLVDQWGCEKYIVKPMVGANSRSVSVVEGAELKREVQSRAQGEWLIQPFVEKIVEGEISFHFFNGEFSHAIKKVPRLGDFRVQEEHGASIFPYEPGHEELEMAQFVLTRVPETLLYARVDMVEYKNTLSLMELELIEPSLYFRTNQKSPVRFVRALKDLLT